VKIKKMANVQISAIKIREKGGKRAMFKRIIRKEKNLSVGFTLIELLVVVAIIGILAAIILPSLNRAREMANRATCKSNMKQYAMALNLYANDFNGAFPCHACGASGQCPSAGAWWVNRYALFSCTADSSVTDFFIGGYLARGGSMGGKNVGGNFSAVQYCPSKGLQYHLQWHPLICDNTYTGGGIIPANPIPGLTQRILESAGKSVVMLMDQVVQNEADSNAHQFRNNDLNCPHWPSGRGYGLEVVNNIYYMKISVDPSENTYVSHGYNEGQNVCFSDSSVQWVGFRPIPTMEATHWGFPVEEVPSLGQFWTGDLHECGGGAVLPLGAARAFYGLL
jgi:prepilin-type N-terminal cleavage/methylation domain-containing protein